MKVLKFILKYFWIIFFALAIFVLGRLSKPNKPPDIQYITDTLTFENVIEDTNARVQARHWYSKWLNLFNKFKEVKIETTYVGGEQLVSLHWNYIIRVDKDGKKMTVYTFQIDSLLKKSQLSEFIEDPNSEKLQSMLADVVDNIEQIPLEVDSEMVFGHVGKYIFNAGEKEFQLFSTLHRPKLIVKKESALLFNFYLAPGYIAYPDKKFSGRIGVELGTERFKFDPFFNSQKQIGVDLRINLIRKGG